MAGFRNLLIPCLCLINACLFGQKDTLYLNEQRLGVSSRNQARFYRIFESTDTGICRVITQNLFEDEYFIEHYTDCQGLLRVGKWYHYQQGICVQEGEYHLGKACGTWYRYSRDGKHLIEWQRYEGKGIRVKLMDTFTFHVREEGFRNQFGLKEGEWIYYYPGSDRVHWTRQYRQDRREGWQMEYYADGNLKRQEWAGKEGPRKWKNKQWSEGGIQEKWVPAYEAAKHRVSLWRYLNQQVPCFLPLVKQQDFEVMLHISVKGEVNGVEVIGLSDSICERNIMIALQKMPRWKPAQREGQAINSLYKQRLHYRKPLE